MSFPFEIPKEHCVCVSQKESQRSRQTYYMLQLPRRRRGRNRIIINKLMCKCCSLLNQMRATRTSWYKVSSNVMVLNYQLWRAELSTNITTEANTLWTITNAMDWCNSCSSQQWPSLPRDKSHITLWAKRSRSWAVLYLESSHWIV